VKGDWEAAISNLHETNNFPEFTGRICPAPCEAACTLNIHKEPVTIRENEAAAAEKGFDLGYIRPNPPKKRTGKKIAVIGSGPAGMACADLLNKWGHDVKLFEKDDAVGGLLRYGIPDFKLNKKVIDRRLDILIREGLKIQTNTHVGIDVKGSELLRKYDAICIATGAMKPRDIPVEGRELKGICFAMEFLTQQNKAVKGLKIPDEERILATGKNVLVIGGGDTGSDCVGTSTRHGAKNILQVEILPKPPEERLPVNPWPFWANVLRTSSSHEEGCERRWNISTKRFLGENGSVRQAEVVEIEWIEENGKMTMVEKPETSQIIDVDLVLLALGFLHPVHEGLADEFGLKFDPKGNIKVDTNYQTSVPKVFAAGDSMMGASLVVRAIHHGRQAAKAMHEFLTKQNPI